MSQEWASFDAAAFKAAYDADGYAVVRGVFPPADVALLKARFDAWRLDMVERHPSTFVHGNHRVWVGEAGGAGGEGSARRVLRGVQWPSYTDPALDSFRTDARMVAIVSALLGPDVKQIINQMHWKQPGSTTQWRYHQDVRARKPDHAFRDLFSSYVNVGIAGERQTEETGAMRVVPASHLCRRDLGIEAVAEEMGVDAHPPSEAELAEMLRRVGVDAGALRPLELAPVSGAARGGPRAWGSASLAFPFSPPAPPLFPFCPTRATWAFGTRSWCMGAGSTPARTATAPFTSRGTGSSQTLTGATWRGWAAWRSRWASPCWCSWKILGRRWQRAGATTPRGARRASWTAPSSARPRTRRRRRRAP